MVPRYLFIRQPLLPLLCRCQWALRLTSWLRAAPVRHGPDGPVVQLPYPWLSDSTRVSGRTVDGTGHTPLRMSTARPLRPSDGLDGDLQTNSQDAEHDNEQLRSVCRPKPRLSLPI